MHHSAIEFPTVHPTRHMYNASSGWKLHVSDVYVHSCLTSAYVGGYQPVCPEAGIYPYAHPSSRVSKGGFNSMSSSPIAKDRYTASTISVDQARIVCDRMAYGNNGCVVPSTFPSSSTRLHTGRSSWATVRLRRDPSMGSSIHNIFTLFSFPDSMVHVHNRFRKSMFAIVMIGFSLKKNVNPCLHL